MRTFRPEPWIACGCALVWSLAEPAIAAAPPGHFRVVGETVEDRATSLTWQRHPPREQYTRKQAAAYCAALTLRGAGWRVPTIKELQTLVDESQVGPAIDEQAFPETQSSHFWSSSAVASFAIYTWTLNFADGTDLWFPNEDPHHVRCVR